MYTSTIVLSETVRDASSKRLETMGIATPTPYESFPDAWWRSQDAPRELLLEWSKVPFYLLGGRYGSGEAD